ncbi:hypothetical protein N7532_005006 [Penicillium argentinense]|uniref:Carrier domain-containing protein n=1 Tax=Penicillium argentinense TaxID=1131581 RepID=A0A9W9FDC5_9EURO|nr:uncharacterized protein N7532_005006 [Penicillium argentinense]KAJ5098005.1 hypothetical protein N7532_005006 [Penicillium argentinense]
MDFGVPNIGNRVMAHVIDNLARTDPGRKVCSIPEIPDNPRSYVDLNVKKLAHAVNYMSWWIVEQFGNSDTFNETLAYLGANDVRYLVVVLACNKTGYKPLLSSTRNSQAAHVRLFEMTNCSKLAYSPEKHLNAQDICSAAPYVTECEIPSFAEMSEQDTGGYPFSKTFEDVRNEVAFIAHSSGTTGFPKPIQLTFGYFGALDYGAHVPIPPGRTAGVPDRLSPEDLILSSTPFFHLMGFALLIMAVFHGIPCVILPDKPLSTELVTNVLSITQPTAALFAPSILEDLSTNTESMEALSKLRRVYFGGGPLSPDVGRKVSESTQLRVASCPPFLPENGDWSYFEWSPTFGITMEHVENGLHEMVLRRHEKPELQPIFHTFPDLECYHTKDLYSPHPTAPNLWKFHGRLDDVIVFNNGEKFNPVTMEKVIEGHPLVARAVVVGLGRFQTALLIEPNWNQWDSIKPGSNLIELVWPTVQEANRISPAHGHVMKSKITLATKNKPFATTPKGSTQRRIVTESYKVEIDQLFTLDDVEEIPFSLPPSPNFPSTLQFVRNLVDYVSNISSCADDADLYNAGFDSLRTMQLAAALRATGFPNIVPQTIYGHPSIGKIATHLHHIIKGDQVQTKSRHEKIDELVKKHTAYLPKKEYSHSLCGSESFTVTLTGSTGSLGSYILDALRFDKSVGKVYCLTRDGKEEKQLRSFQERGLDETLPDKIEFVQTSLGAPHLGIDDSKYKEMLRSVNTVIHNAWKMDFNISVESFEEAHIRTVRNLIDFSLQSAHRAHIHFLSSIGAIGGWTLSNGPVIPELPFEDCDVALRQGYSEAKHICERICLAASQTSGVPTSIHRLGQIAGPCKRVGFWNVQEWIPALVATSKSLGKVPSTLGGFKVDWVPVDLLSRIIVDIVQTRQKTQRQDLLSVFHLVNPTAASWSSLLEPISTRYKLVSVDMKEWVDELKEIKNPSPKDLVEKPALKLIGFYQSLVEGEGVLSVPLELEHTKAASETMRSLPSITPAMMENWLKQWAF